MKIDFDLLEKMVSAGASARMIVDTLKEKSIKSHDAKIASAFLQFRAAYPKRDGSNPWRPAEQKFYNLVKSGIEPGAIVAAAIRFAQEEAARGKVGTPYIPMAQTWLNQHRFKDVSSATSCEAPEVNWEQALANYHRFRTWQTKYYGPSPDSPACRAPRELLVKHGLVA